MVAASMVVVIVTMGVAMAQFLAARFANFLDGDIEMQRDAGQGMIGVDGDIFRIHTHYRDHARPTFTHGLKLHTHLNILIGIELRTRKLLHQTLVSGAIGIFRGDHGVDLIARRLAFQRRFQAGNDIACAMDIGEGASAMRTVQLRTLCIGEGVIYGDDLVFGDLH